VGDQCPHLRRQNATAGWEDVPMVPGSTSRILPNGSLCPAALHSPRYLDPAVDPVWLLRTNPNKVGVSPCVRPRERQAALGLMCGTFAEGAPTAGGLRSA
jgi:hypothetical protein